LGNKVREGRLRQRKDSQVFIQPPAVLVTLPGPILSSFPQSTAVGSSSSAAVGNVLGAQGVPVSSSSFEYSYSFRDLGCFGSQRGCYPL
ncbi:KRFA protein, partial [Rhynochetos jubatus]|nr:KRFA protein [Rhynochetos jubatus]